MDLMEDFSRLVVNTLVLWSHGMGEVYSETGPAQYIQGV